MFIEIYGRLSCPYCIDAIELAKELKAENPLVDFIFIDMIEHNISKQDLEPRVGKTVRTVPQIFIDKMPIGGFTDFDTYANEHLFK